MSIISFAYYKLHSNIWEQALFTLKAYNFLRRSSHVIKPNADSSPMSLQFFDLRELHHCTSYIFQAFLCQIRASDMLYVRG